MYELTERLKRLREEAVNVKSISPRICAQRSYWDRYGRALLEPGKEYDNIVISAAGTASVMKNAPAIIGEDELIVGYNFGDGNYEWLTGIREEDTKRLAQSGFSAEQIRWFYDETIPVKSCRKVPVEDVLSEKERMLREECTILNSAGDQSLTANHSVIGYEKVLAKGFEGLLAETEHYALQNGNSSFYDALRMICEAGMVLGENYAREAERMGREDIALVCRQVPGKGARSFREAVQSLWFAHIINTWEDTINANSLGRLDQILYPFYRQDLEAGVLTREEAFEIICCLWIKLYRDYDVQQSCVGGCNPDGTTAVNELSYMMLDATERLGYVRCLSVRFDQKTDRRFLERALQVVGHVQKGIPFFFNDDVMIPALVSAGISYEDACDYTQIGCVETVIPGKSNPHAVNTRCNLLKALDHDWQQYDLDEYVYVVEAQISGIFSGI